jgi:hypothetical protein
MNGHADTSERNQSLWLITGSPMLWGAHFLLCYATAAIWCAKVAGLDGPLTTVRGAIVVYTAVALAGIVIIGTVGLRRHRLGKAPLPHDADTPEDRHRFLGFATVLLSALSAVAVIWAALVTVYIDGCY